jgi:hypothetical protein
MTAPARPKSHIAILIRPVGQRRLLKRAVGAVLLVSASLLAW